MTYDMLIRKKALKIQERLGMRIGIAYGTKKCPVVRTTQEALDVLRDLYKIGLKAFVLPKEMFGNIQTTTDLYKVHYGNLLKIRDIAKKYNIELSLHHPTLPEEPDEILKTFSNITSVLDARIFTVNPSFYSKIMPHDQAMKLAVYKINEIASGLRVSSKIGVETTGKMQEVGSLEDVIDIVKRTQGTEPVMDWGHIHARGTGALREQKDFESVIGQVRNAVGSVWLDDAFFFFRGVSYGPSGLTRYVPIDNSDMKLEYLIKGIMSYNMKGTLILDDPDREKFILKILDRLADMVR
jgi:deoxyribonuclease-4